jgi:hypothetical protein
MRFLDDLRFAFQRIAPSQPVSLLVNTATEALRVRRGPFSHGSQTLVDHWTTAATATTAYTKTFIIT